MNTRFLIVALSAIALASCVNPYAGNFRYAPGVTSDTVAERRAAAPTGNPEIIDGANPQSDLLAQESDGYMPIGYADFSAAPGFVPRDGAVKQGVQIGADRILVYSQYQGTVNTAIPITTPTQQTTYYNGTATAFGSGGSTTAFGSGTATTVGTQTQFMPLSISRYEFLAIYLVKAKVWFGAVCLSLTPEAAQAVGTVDAVRVAVVVHGSPAAAAGLVPGDIVTAIDGKPFDSAKGFVPMLKANAGRHVSLTVIRGGASLTKDVSLPSA